MGDLIIKPEAGGSIKLQNNAGTNALVSDNSGNITVGGALGVTGSVTLAGSANNLGTVTAGSIAGGSITSATTFPAGHVIQARIYLDGSQVNVTSTSFNTADVAGNFQFTPLVATSNILLLVSCTVYANTAGGYTYSDIYKNASDVTETSNLTGYSAGLCVNHHNGSWTGASYSWLDTCPENSLSEKTYKISARANGVGSNYIGWGAALPNTMVIQEITT
jgi:hypothetical protein